ncbi:hypothetical protein E2C01_035410 [Portunus trituberculatus]|uniref:Uncharacterized protein n=1 Tax=Portunus trituberculatus TaxID=210409 RepID=A0A5B7FBE0_PORTR|nr:hypothetical protein [Portunus trituberculatus]
MFLFLQRRYFRVVITVQETPQHHNEPTTSRHCTPRCTLPYPFTPFHSTSHSTFVRHTQSHQTIPTRVTPCYIKLHHAIPYHATHCHTTARLIKLHHTTYLVKSCPFIQSYPTTPNHAFPRPTLPDYTRLYHPISYNVKPCHIIPKAHHVKPNLPTSYSAVSYHINLCYSAPYHAISCRTTSHCATPKQTVHLSPHITHHHRKSLRYTHHTAPHPDTTLLAT